MLALTALIAFYSLGGQEALVAEQTALQQNERDRSAVLLALGVPSGQLPGAQPLPLAASVQRVASRFASGVQAAGTWATEATSGLVRLMSDQLAALRADRPVRGRVAPPLLPAPRPGTRIRLAREPELLDEAETAHGAPRMRTAAGKLGAGAGGAGLPWRSVVQHARQQEAGALPPVIEGSSAIAPASGAVLRAAGKAAPPPAPEIVAVAENLERSPGRIFRFVHDSIAFDSQWGADASPVGTLYEGRGSSWEQAWLLQQLLVAAGVDARLEWGQIEISPALLQNLTGVSDIFRAGDLLTTGGTDIVLITQGGQVVGARLPHAWVKAYLDYVPNRGATAGPGDTWIRMDPTLERFDEAYGERLDAAVPFALAAYLPSGTESSPRAV
ncbi:MAG TPA: transglutaminase family protein, partial [Thermoanaerobaculia bacterium]|nr:transglutaminase family protein [Thermoanaerobaculia bacterium]